jgi:hypothetical protein
MKFYFNGCSITQGAGFANEKLNSNIYPNLLATDHINDASGGASNLKIFLHSSKAIIDNLADAYIVQWSALHRHWVYPAPDQGIYIGSMLDPGQTNSDFVAQYQLLNHDYGNIMQLIDFCRILQDQASSHQAKLIFVNGLVDWSNSQDWMVKLVEDASSDHDRFIETLQNNLELVDWNLWINPWNNMYDSRLDEADDGLHPGPLTHKHIADQIRDKLVA